MVKNMFGSETMVEKGNRNDQLRKANKKANRKRCKEIGQLGKVNYKDRQKRPKENGQLRKLTKNTNRKGPKTPTLP
jgi:hypothetical protein